MNKKNKNIKFIIRLTIWLIYLLAGYSLYFSKSYLPSFLITFTKVIYPQSIFWLQIRLNNKEPWISISNSMSTAQLWYRIIPLTYSILSFMITVLNLLFILVSRI